jgi:ribosomal protein S18 acetylase RimI-like enzyme
MHDFIAISSPAGVVHLRPERNDDWNFRYLLFCNSRPPEWDHVQLDPALREQLMRHQFQAQTMTYAARFPHARFDIIELTDERIGRIVVNRPGDVIHVVDQAIIPPLRNQGIGTAIMRALMQEGTESDLPVRLKVADANDPSLRFYVNLGFVPIQEIPAYIEIEWRAQQAATFADRGEHLVRDE